MEQAWREWCFLRAVARRMRWRLLAFVGVVLSATTLLWVTSEDPPISYAQAMYEAWFLLFANPSGGLHREIVPRVLTFVLPVLGLAGIIEAVVDLAMLMRDRRQTERSWCTIMAGTMRGHVVLVGLGKLGFRTYQLLRGMGERVVVIEIDERKQFLDEVRRDGSALIIGDARHDRVLADANVASAKAIVLATDLDLVNLEAAFDAKRLNPSIRVVTRMFDQVIADKVTGAAGIQVAMSQAVISAPAFATAAVASGVVASTLVGNRLVITRRLTLAGDHALAGQTVGWAMTKYGIGVVERRGAGGEPQLFPPPEQALAAGESVLVQGPFEVVAGMAGG